MHDNADTTMTAAVGAAQKTTEVSTRTIYSRTDAFIAFIAFVKIEQPGTPASKLVPREWGVQGEDMACQFRALTASWLVSQTHMTPSAFEQLWLGISGSGQWPHQH